MHWGKVFSNGATAMFNLEACYYALLAIGLNMQFGYAGLANFGQVGFLAVGSYGMGITVAYFGGPLWLGFLVGLVAAIVLALLLGIPTLRLRADYLAIATIAAADIIRLLARSVTYRQYTGGSTGLSGFASGFYDLNPYPDGRFDFGPFHYSYNRLWILTVGWGFVIVTSVILWLVVRSPWGRVLKAIREDEDAARALGKNVYAYKLQALVIGGVVGALGGFVLALGNSNVQPELYSRDFTFFAYAALILGGAARILGPVIGAMIFWVVLSVADNVLFQASAAGYIPHWVFDQTQTGVVRLMLVGLGLMLLVIFRPQGIFGDRRELALDAH
jgi:branched-chain amino acid transport system permease protein